MGVSGLTGAPDFWAQPAVAVGSPDLATPAGYGQELDDPRWNTAWHYDFASGGGTRTGIRAIEDDTGHFLYLSFLVYQDPIAFSTADQIYLGISDGTHGDLARISVSGTDPLPAFRNAPQPHTGVWWGTSDGGTTWTGLQNGAGKSCSGGPTGPAPLCWVEANMLRVWTGSGTYAATGSASGTDNLGFAWVVNARIDLTKVGLHLGLGTPLSRPYRIFAEISIAVPANLPIRYDWPPASQLSFDGAGLPVSSVSAWGQASADMTACAGTAVNDVSIGLTPVATGTPKTPSASINVGPTNPANTFVAILSGANGAALPPAGTVKARFRMANCGSIGAAGTWNDILPSPFFTATNGMAPFGSDTISWSCGGTSGVACPPFNSATQSANQCLLVELINASSPPETFVQDSAWRNVAFVEPDAGASDGGDGGGRPVSDAGSDATVGQDAGTVAESSSFSDSSESGNTDGEPLADTGGVDADGGGTSPSDAAIDATVGQDAGTVADSGASSDSSGGGTADAPLLADAGGPDRSSASGGGSGGCSCRNAVGQTEGGTFLLPVAIVAAMRLRRHRAVSGASLPRRGLVPSR